MEWGEDKERNCVTTQKYGDGKKKREAKMLYLSISDCPVGKKIHDNAKKTERKQGISKCLCMIRQMGKLRYDYAKSIEC